MKKLTSLAIIFLALGQILINIKISSYRKDMNSLWETQMKINHRFWNHIDYFSMLQEYCFDFLDSCEHNSQNYQKLFELL